MAEHPELFELTLAQAIAIHRVYNRMPLYAHAYEAELPNQVKAVRYHETQEPMTFEEFASLVQYGSNCIMIPWVHMWLGIEKNGYVHS